MTGEWRIAGRSEWWRASSGLDWEVMSTLGCTAILLLTMLLQGSGASPQASPAVSALESLGAGGGEVAARLPGIGAVTLRMRPFRAVSHDATVEVGARGRSAAPGLVKALHGVRHYEGTVDGFGASSAYVAVGTTGVAAMVDLGPGNGLFGLRALDCDDTGLCDGPSEFVRISGVAAPEVDRCRCLPAGDQAQGGTAGFAEGIPPGVRKVIEVAIDSDYEYYSTFASATALAEYTAALIGEVSAIYRRDCSTTFAVSYLRVQDSADDLFNEPDPLYPFREYWAAEGGSINRDIFTLFTGRRNLPYGGVAYLNAVCSADYGFSVNGFLLGTFVSGSPSNPGSWDVNVVAHEFGHNCGSLHTPSYGIDQCGSGVLQRGTIMSYCHILSGASANIDLYLHRGTVKPIDQFLATCPCLASDCDDDGVPDDQEIADDPTIDANADGIIDACQDCDGNGVPDPVQIAGGLLADADGDGQPDVCEEDCNANGIPDADEAAENSALDLNGDGVLASCEIDCDGNGVADSDQINADMSLDVNRDGRLDACEDCDGDGILDAAELRGSRSRWVGSATDNLLRELDPRSGVLRRTVVVGDAPINDLIVADDGLLYAAAGNRVWVLDRVADAAARPWGPAHDSEVRSVAQAPDGRIAALLASGRVMLISTSGTDAEQYAAAFSDDDARDVVFRQVAGGSRDALVSTGAGLIHRIAWPSGVRTVFADMTEQAPGLRGMHVMADGGVLVAASALDGIYRVGGAGQLLGRWDVQEVGIARQVYAIADARDGRSIITTSPVHSSTVNGYVATTGYHERTLRSYPADAPAATAIVIAPPSEADRNGNLNPDECECLGDVSGDGAVDGADITALLAAWGTSGQSNLALDINADGIVNGLDLAFVLASWGDCGG